MKLPAHKAGLTIEHNPHLNYYESVEQHIKGSDVESIHWESEEDKLRCFHTNELWAIQWYPDSPVGSVTVAASTLDKALALALEVEKQPA